VEVKFSQKKEFSITEFFPTIEVQKIAYFIVLNSNCPLDGIFLDLNSSFYLFSFDAHGRKR
jgi:hypothetical protein